MFKKQKNDSQVKEESEIVLKVLTLNVAHARKHWLQQLTRQKNPVEKNLKQISKVFLREKADVIAMQEVDSSTRGSAHFDHVAYLAYHAKYPNLLKGKHGRRMFITYGTALISKFALHRSRSYQFYRTPLRFPKGFVVSTIHLPDASVLEIDLVSLHLDPIRKSIRKKQILELVDLLRYDNNPIIIMGDFNCGWAYKDSTLHTLVDLLELKVFKPNDRGLITFPQFHKRYDWILISQELKFHSYKVLEDHLSDHQAVVAEICINTRTTIF